MWAPGVTNRYSNPQKMSVPMWDSASSPRTILLNFITLMLLGGMGEGKGTGKKTGNKFLPPNPAPEYDFKPVQ